MDPMFVVVMTVIGLATIGVFMAGRVDGALRVQSCCPGA